MAKNNKSKVEPTDGPTLNHNSTEYLEPVLYKGVPYWLARTYELVSDLKRPVKNIIKDDCELERRVNYFLEKDSTWRCLKCGNVTQSKPDPPLECYKEAGGCGRGSKFAPVAKQINPDLWILPTWEDIKAEDLDMQNLYIDMLELIKSLLIFTNPVEYDVFTLWIISTWKLEAWDTVGYPVFIGIPESGKSRALQIISELARRAPKSSGIKAAAIPRLSHYYDVTMLLDEAHNKLNPRTESGSALLDFVKDGYKKGSVYITCDNNNQDSLIITRNFGFKAFAGEKTFRPALLSRGFTFYMIKAEPEIAKISYAKDDFKSIRTKLLNYRYKTNDPPDLGNEFILKGRSREIFESIIATAEHIGINYDNIIEYALKRSELEEDALRESDQFQILQIIKNIEENPRLSDAPEGVLTWEILNALEWDLGTRQETNKSTQRLGYHFKNMGLVTSGKGKKRMLLVQKEPNRSNLDALYKRYKIDYTAEGIE